MFGCYNKVDLNSSCLSEDAVVGIETEEDLDKLISEKRNESIEMSDEDEIYKEGSAGDKPGNMRWRIPVRTKHFEELRGKC